MNFRAGFKRQSGFTFIEIFAAIAIAGMVAMGAAALFQQLNQTQTKSDRLFWISARKLEFQNTIRSDSGWAQILASNPTMACLANPAQNCLAYKTPQALRLPMDGTTLDGTNPALGMSSSGDFCYQYDSVNGDSSCPIGVKLSWQAVCNDAQCHHPQPKITVDFSINDARTGAQQVINANNQLVVFRDQTLQTLNDVCTSMGGVLNAGVCVMPQFASACDPANGSFVLGFDPQGVVICGKPSPGSCAGSDIGYGFSTSGTILCAAAGAPGPGGLCFGRLRFPYAPTKGPNCVDAPVSDDCMLPCATNGEVLQHPYGGCGNAACVCSCKGAGGMCMTCASQCAGGVPTGANGANCRCGDGSFQFCL